MKGRIPEFDGLTTEEMNAGLQCYTAIVNFGEPEENEEIDVIANDRKEATELARQVLIDDYEGRGKIIRWIGPRVGLYL